MALFTMLLMLIGEKFYYWVIKHGMIKGVVHQIRPDSSATAQLLFIVDGHVSRSDRSDLVNFHNNILRISNCFHNGCYHGNPFEPKRNGV